MERSPSSTIKKEYKLFRSMRQHCVFLRKEARKSRVKNNGSYSSVCDDPHHDIFCIYKIDFKKEKMVESCNTFVFKLFIIWKKEIVNFEDFATEDLNKGKEEFEKESNFGELFDVVIHPADQSENDLHAANVLLSQPTRLTNNFFSPLMNSIQWSLESFFSSGFLWNWLKHHW